MNNAFVLLQGFGLLFQPKIRHFVIWPLILNIFIFVALIYGAYTFGLYAQQESLSLLPDWLSYISWLIWPVIFILVLLCLLYGFSVLANLIAAPFNAFLSEAVEEHYGFIEAGQNSMQQLLLSIPASIGRELQKLLYSLPWWLLAFIVSFIPLLNILSLVIAAWLMAIQYMDYPADNHRIRFRKSLQLLRQRRLLLLPFGGSILLANLVPIINLLTMPAAVCAATVLWHQAGFQQKSLSLKP